MAMTPIIVYLAHQALAGDLGGEPGHDVQRRLDELHRRLQQQRHAQAARADARDGQPAPTASPASDTIHMESKAYQVQERSIPDDPDDGADDGDEDGEHRERQAQQKPQRPALAAVVAAAAHRRPGRSLSLSFPHTLCSFACLSSELIDSCY
uniref:Uncharacterized protein n=1 Tax=Setaria italica TaxID=4555 RepID=K3ZAG0_SETIT